MKKLIIFALLLYFIISCLKQSGNSDTETIGNNESESSSESSTYYSTWTESTKTTRFAEISKVLMYNNVELCPSFYTKRSVSSSEEYLIACTPDDGKSWYYYQLWISSKTILGPYSNFTDEPVTPPY